MRQDDDLYINAELSIAQQRAVQRKIAKGDLFRVQAGIATPLNEQDWPALFRREKIRIMAALFPESVVSYRSAFDAMASNTIYLTGSYSREVALPGLKVVISAGPGPLETDTRIQGRALYFPSRERMLLQAMAPAKKVDGGSNKSNAPEGDMPKYSRKISEQELEERLISICDARGEQAFTQLRASIAQTAEQLKTPTAHVRELDRLMGAILGTRPDRKMSTLQGAGRAKRYDAERLELFKKLSQTLKSTETPVRKEIAATAASIQNFAFLESYFSNFIEGTEFEVSEARAIALEGKVNAIRAKDSHDILGVFKQAQGPAWRSKSITDIHGFIDTLRERHALMMDAREEILPGEFKMVRNVAGNTSFVEPGLVLGTLKEAGLLVHDVDPGLPRALLAMFIISEVHPFNDGNGRLARLIMNSELSAAGQSRIIIPTLYREQYLDCLRELTRQGNVKPYMDAMVNIQDWTKSFDYENLDDVIAQMAQCNAFEKSLNGHRLLWPSHTPPCTEPKSSAALGGDTEVSTAYQRPRFR